MGRSRLIRLAIALGVLATLAGLASMLTSEIVMAPTTGERNTLIALMAVLGAVAVGGTLAMRAFAPRSLTRRMFLSVVSGPIVVAIAIAAGSRTMIIKDNDIRFLLILLAFATVLAVGVVYTLAQPLSDDLARLTDVARRVGRGDLDARTELKRMDEVGELAEAIDSMVEEIASSRAARDASEHERSITMASLSHDARTPLTSMRLATEALIDGVAVDPERYLRTIAADIDAVDTLISDLFTLGQLEAGRLEVTAYEADIVPVVHDVIEGLTLIAHHRDVQLDATAPDRCTASADVDQLHRVLTNVVSNAVRHSPNGGTVHIEVDGDRRQISVVDEGPGFPPDFVDEAFQPFRRHDEARERAFGGAGLGLAVSKGIIDALGGRIWADPGPGGRVTIELAASTSGVAPH